MDRFSEFLDEAIGANEHNMERDRPYNGQPHTDTGTRGATEISGVTFRDLRDCFIRAWCLSAGHINELLYEEALKGDQAALCDNDLYGLEGSIDPIAISQNLGCEIEKLMGIFPNVPPLTIVDASGASRVIEKPNTHPPTAGGDIGQGK